jgi:hypothetical protein
MVMRTNVGLARRVSNYRDLPDWPAWILVQWNFCVAPE